MISVCMATHNGEKYIKEQLSSILCQIGDNDEVVISDDGSTDGTLSIIYGIHDSRIKLFSFSQPISSGRRHEYVCHNFENAINHAKGDVIFLSDQDDIWMTDKVKICMKDLQSNDLVLHDFMHINEQGEVIRPLNYKGYFRRYNLLIRSGKHYGCAMAFNRNILDYVLPFPKHILLHDYWIGILVELLGRFYFEEKPLIKHRSHQDNASGHRNPLWFGVFYRLRILLSVFVRVVMSRLKH